MDKQKINLLGIAPYRFLPAINGGHKAIEQLYRYVSDLVTTIVISTNNNTNSHEGNYELIKLFSSRAIHYINVFYFFRIKKIIKHHRITHLMIEHPYMGWLGVLLKRYAGVTFIVRSHNIESVRFKTLGKWWWKLMWLYEKWVFGKADLIFFITDDDKQFAVEKYHLSPQRCDVLTYGIDRQTAPSFNEKAIAKAAICKQYHVPFSNTILLFNGDLGYSPNTLAVEAILTKINPLLLQHSSLQYTLFICGKNLPDHLQKQIQNESKHIIYAGFVNDVVQYFLAADVFINPVIEGGGIKTKLVEALGCNCNAVSTVSGAAGLMQIPIHNKLQVVNNGDWEAFAGAVFTSNTEEQIPADFYKHFYWGNIARKAVDTLLSLEAK